MRIYVFGKPVAAVQPHVRHFTWVPRASRATSSDFPFSLRKKNGSSAHSLLLSALSPPLLLLLLLLLLLRSPIVLCASRAARLASFHDTTEPRLHVPDNAGGSLLFREWWKVADDASSLSPSPREQRPRGRCRVVKERGTDGKERGA